MNDLLHVSSMKFSPYSSDPIPLVFAG